MQGDLAAALPSRRNGGTEGDETLAQWRRLEAETLSSVPGRTRHNRTVLTRVTSLPAACPYLDGSALLVPDDAACRLLTASCQAGLGFPTAAGAGCKGFATLQALQPEWVSEPWRWLGLAEHGFRWLSRWRLHARAD